VSFGALTSRRIPLGAKAVFSIDRSPPRNAARSIARRPVAFRADPDPRRCR
jgi:hypothetical protein